MAHTHTWHSWARQHSSCRCGPHTTRQRLRTSCSQWLQGVRASGRLGRCWCRRSSRILRSWVPLLQVKAHRQGALVFASGTQQAAADAHTAPLTTAVSSRVLAPSSQVGIALAALCSCAQKEAGGAEGTGGEGEVGAKGVKASGAGRRQPLSTSQPTDRGLFASWMRAGKNGSSESPLMTASSLLPHLPCQGKQPAEWLSQLPLKPF